MPGKRGRTLEDRFWSKVGKSVEPNACWPWVAGIFPSGYGAFTMPDGSCRRAHRVAWTLDKGDPGELFVLHKCDNRKCCNPGHLYVGTHDDNMKDKTERSSYRGEIHHKSKMTEDSVRELRTRYSNGGITLKELGAEYGINKASVRSIVNLEHWRHVQDPGVVG